MSLSLQCQAIKKERLRKPTNYQSSWLLDYGLKIAGTCPKTKRVLGLHCRFCNAFGKETPPEEVRKRAKSKKAKGWTDDKFRTDHFKEHLEHDHPKNWAIYQELTYDKRDDFFTDQKNQSSVKAMWKKQRVNVHDPYFVYLSKDIVETVIEKFIPSDAEVDDDDNNNNSEDNQPMDDGTVTPKDRVWKLLTPLDANNEEIDMMVMV